MQEFIQRLSDLAPLYNYNNGFEFPYGGCIPERTVELLGTLGIEVVREHDPSGIPFSRIVDYYKARVSLEKYAQELVVDGVKHLILIGDESLVTIARQTSGIMTGKWV